MKKLLIVAVYWFQLSCTSESVQNGVEISDEFNDSKSGWEAGFADYPMKRNTDWQFEEGLAHLPKPLDTLRRGFRISGRNHSDDLFMFFKKKIGGLAPDRLYKASFSIDFASNAPSTGHIGVGGAPGDIKLGIGAVPYEPVVYRVDGSLPDSADYYYRINIDKIDQNEDGKDMVVIGDIGNGRDEWGYTMINRTGEFVGKTDREGNLWLIFGTDSGFEAQTTLYYARVKVQVVPHGEEDK